MGGLDLAVLSALQTRNQVHWNSCVQILLHSLFACIGGLDLADLSALQNRNQVH